MEMLLGILCMVILGLDLCRRSLWGSVFVLVWCLSFRFLFFFWICLFILVNWVENFLNVLMDFWLIVYLVWNLLCLRYFLFGVCVESDFIIIINIVVCFWLGNVLSMNWWGFWSSFWNLDCVVFGISCWVRYGLLGIKLV